MAGNVPTLLALDPGLMIATFTLIGALLLGAVVIAFVRRWQQMQNRLGPTASDELAQYRLLYEQGKLTEAEYRRLRDVLSTELRKAVDVPAKPAPVPVPPVTAIQPETPPPADPPPADPPTTDIRPAT